MGGGSVTRLGVVLAGGRSSRFGSDKAEALLNGTRLLDHAVAALRRHTDQVSIAGRAENGVIGIADHPAPGLGPLGGLAGALLYARDHGFAEVLSCGVDCPDVPAAILRDPPCFLAAQPVIGLWPVAVADRLAQFVATDPRRSVRGFAKVIGAKAIDSSGALPNLNTPADLARLQADRDPADVRGE